MATCRSHPLCTWIGCAVAAGDVHTLTATANPQASLANLLARIAEHHALTAATIAAMALEGHPGSSRRRLITGPPRPSADA